MIEDFLKDLAAVYALEISLEIFLGLTFTVLVYFVARSLYERTGKVAFFQPILLALIFILCVLLFLDISYEDYRGTVGPLHFMIGPVTVALAVPLYEHGKAIKALLLPIILSIVVCGVFTVVVTITIAHLLGASEEVLLTLSTKSITTPIALIVTEKIGGIAPLAAIIVTVTGIIGVSLAMPIFRWFKIDDPKIQGVTLGLSSHAIGTAKAMETNPMCGAFSAIGMGITGLITAFTLPVVIALFF